MVYPFENFAYHSISIAEIKFIIRLSRYTRCSAYLLICLLMSGRYFSSFQVAPLRSMDAWQWNLLYCSNIHAHSADKDIFQQKTSSICKQYNKASARVLHSTYKMPIQTLMISFLFEFAGKRNEGKILMVKYFNLMKTSHPLPHIHLYYGYYISHIFFLFHWSLSHSFRSHFHFGLFQTIYELFSCTLWQRYCFELRFLSSFLWVNNFETNWVLTKQRLAI